MDVGNVSKGKYGRKDKILVYSEWKDTIKNLFGSPTYQVTRTQALENKLKFYYGTPCTCCGESVRYTSNSNCRKCHLLDVGRKNSGDNVGLQERQSLKKKLDDKLFELSTKEYDYDF